LTPSLGNDQIPSRYDPVADRREPPPVRLFRFFPPAGPLTRSKSIFASAPRTIFWTSAGHSCCKHLLAFPPIVFFSHPWVVTGFRVEGSGTPVLPRHLIVPNSSTIAHFPDNASSPPIAQLRTAVLPKYLKLYHFGTGQTDRRFLSKIPSVLRLRALDLTSNRLLDYRIGSVVRIAYRRSLCWTSLFLKFAQRWSYYCRNCVERNVFSETFGNPFRDHNVSNKV